MNLSHDNRLFDLLAQWETSRRTEHELTVAELCRDCPELYRPLADHILALRSTDWLLDPDEPADDALTLPAALAEALAPAVSGTLTVQDFETQIAACGLVSHEQVQSVRRDVEPASAQQLAHELVRQRQLTRYQAQEIADGHGERLVLGNYIVLDRIGAGGMGQVYKAVHKRMERVVALKVLPQSVQEDPRAAERFRREVRAAARLDHPHIVTAFDADEGDGTLFLVMQYVEGEDLAKHVRRSGPLPVDRALDYLRQAALGLEYAHQHGVIHRDIKPSNLLLAFPPRSASPRVQDGSEAQRDRGTGKVASHSASPPMEGHSASPPMQGHRTSPPLQGGAGGVASQEDERPTSNEPLRSSAFDVGRSAFSPSTDAIAGEGGTIKILDMGLARLDDDSDAAAQRGLTHTGAVMGTADYMSPEQGVDTHHADPRSDIYSLGCTLHFLLTGRPPFRGGNVVKKVLAHREQPIPSLCALRPDVPLEVDLLFQRMLAKSPADRHQTAGDLLHAIDECRTELESQRRHATPAPFQDLEDYVSSQPTSPPLGKGAASPPLQGHRASPPLQGHRASPLSKGGPGGGLVAGNRPPSPPSLAQQLTEASTLRPTTATLATRFAPRRDKPRGPLRWLLALLAGGVLLAGAVIVKLQTRDGTLIIELPDATDVIVAIDGRRATITRQGTTVTIEVPPGQHEKLQIATSDGLKLWTDAEKGFEIAAGGKLILKARFEKVSPNSATSPQAAEQPIPIKPSDERKTAEWLLALGGGLTVVVPGHPQLDAITHADQLPAEDFHVIEVGVAGPSIDDAALDRISQLNELVSLTVYDAPRVTDSGTKHLTKLKRLQLLQLVRTELGLNQA